MHTIGFCPLPTHPLPDPGDDRPARMLSARVELGVDGTRVSLDDEFSSLLVAMGPGVNDPCPAPQDGSRHVGLFNDVTITTSLGPDARRTT